jgi:hypothetical protein
MRARLLIPTAALAAASAAGCGVGDGTGSAKGDLFMLGCLDGHDFGSPTMPQPWDLQPTYFVGEPIEDIADPSDAKAAMNELIIRLQRNGNALEITDTLYFDVPNSAEVAKCLRGRTVNGVGDWDMTTGTVDPVDATHPPWCMAPVAVADGGTGFPRIRLVPSGPVRSSFTPLGYCVSTMHPPAIVSITGVAADGYIDFLDFGGAMQNGKSPDMRDPIPNDFKVNFGERLNANFSFTMGDDRVLTAIKLMVNPPPDPTIGGTMAGNFDFDLQRGQGAQTFP